MQRDITLVYFKQTVSHVINATVPSRQTPRSPYRQDSSMPLPPYRQDSSMPCIRLRTAEASHTVTLCLMPDVPLLWIIMQHRALSKSILYYVNHDLVISKWNMLLQLDTKLYKTFKAKISFKRFTLLKSKVHSCTINAHSSTAGFQHQNASYKVKVKVVIPIHTKLQHIIQCHKTLSNAGLNWAAHTELTAAYCRSRTGTLMNSFILWKAISIVIINSHV